jgi:hypothetical protein
MQSDCASAFVVSDELEPDMLAYLTDVRQLRQATDRHLTRLELGEAAGVLRAMEELLDALDDQLVALQKGVDWMHRRFSDLMDEGVQFDEGNEYRLMLREDQGEVKHGLLRRWVLQLPHVREWLREGGVQSEEDALMLAVSAGGSTV